MPSPAVPRFSILYSESLLVNRAIGLVAIIVGGLGAALLVADAAAVWRVEWEVVDRTDRVTIRLSDRLAAIERKLKVLEGKVQNVTIDVIKIEPEVARLVQSAVKNVLDPAEWNQFLDRFHGVLQQCEAFGETLQLAANLLEDVAFLSAQLNGNKNITEHLQNIATAIELAAAKLAGIRAELPTLRSRETNNSQRLADIVVQTRGSLERLAGTIESILQLAEEARDDLQRVRVKVRRYARSIAALVCLLSAGFFWGQICLVGWGRRRWGATP